jgi:hypothetical protein
MIFHPRPAHAEPDLQLFNARICVAPGLGYLESLPRINLETSFIRKKHAPDSTVKPSFEGKS